VIQAMVNCKPILALIMPGYEVIGSEEEKEILEIFNNGGILFRHGFDKLRNNCYKVKQFEQEFATAMGVDHALAVSSGTAALRVALAALGIGQGVEVITQSFTFVATLEAIIESRAVPLCVDIDTTLNMDPQDLERRITPRTKAVIVVHMLGTPARLPEIAQICRRHNLFLIEDTAWGCGGALMDKPLGTWGDVGTFSFDFAKTMTTGEGGMLVFRNEEVYKRAAAWHDHGHENNPTVPRWEDTRSSSGYNCRMTELQGAIGLAQLRKLKQIVNQQRANKLTLWAAISDLPGIDARLVPDKSYETADALVFMVKDNETARRCRDELFKVGLTTKILPEAYTWHFAGTWDHMPELVAAHGGSLSNSFSHSHNILSRAVSLPIGVKLADDAPEKVRVAILNALST
jgi:8-amino-3,8-dideoxy-alpha-D-manno-octulosonate transaminase